MKTLHSLSELRPSPGQLLFSWILSPSYREVKNKAHQAVHLRFDTHNREDLDRLLASMKPETADQLRATPEFRAASLYLCDSRPRPGRLVA